MSAPHITDEARAKSFLDGWQAEERFKAHRNARVRREALALQAGIDHRRAPRVARSLPSGPAPDMRVLALGLALLIPSAVGLGIAAAGLVGLSVLRASWDFATRRKA